MKRAQYFLDRKDFAVFDLQRRIRENCKRFYRIQCQIEKGGPLEVLRAVTNEKAVVVGMIKKDLGQGANTIFKARRRAEKEFSRSVSSIAAGLPSSSNGRRLTPTLFQPPG